MAVAGPKVFDYAVEVDRGGRMTVPGGAQLEPGEGWSPDHLLLAALVRCSIDSLTYHARRAGHEVSASGSAHATVTRRDTDGRYALAEADVRIEAQLRPRAAESAELAAKAERDTDGRYALAEADVRIDAQLRPRAAESAELAAKAERDCFVGASLTIAPRYEWHVS